MPILQTLVERGYEIVSGGTENHLVLVNLKNKVSDLFHTSTVKYIEAFVI